MVVLEFEKPIFELETKIKELKDLNTGDLSISNEIRKLEEKLKKMLHKVYSDLSPWQIVQVARHPSRPQTLDYVEKLLTDFVPLCGDRSYGDDKAIVAGLAKFNGMPVAILGHQKGRDTEERIKYNFGMPHPEGYRKACRIMKMADKFNLPLLTFVDTAGAYPGVGAEERGQAEAIGRCLEESMNVRSPIISLVIGEGGSGGAVALAAADKILMLEYSTYSVISPEGCASILWRDSAKSKDAAEALKITANDLLKYKLIDAVIREPQGGAHRDPDLAIKNAGIAIENALKETLALKMDLRTHRREKFFNFGRAYDR